MSNTNRLLTSKKLQPMRYKVYIAGKVTGLPYKETFEKFLKVEEMLRRLGHEVVNPMRLVTQGTDWQSAMRICIPALYGCNAIYLLPDWHESKGANLEYHNADAMRFTLVNDLVIGEMKTRIANIEKQFPQFQD
ncbi:DUF4406 domain-containing protein [Plebeiibacterium sediminum]|uniref:DUF4406 domain-containing protein n=1 Tax=Plebeiibacterium sediminum TaxID=2992112 RepID=A0AAE3M1A1_9BACT|nr:DUF4406 domain-containing protein [Plebeiobacterium sediminum]MCW3784900.1 DUF4406 domain-containing protein [Plebeiobacterium sediminum]